jgi:hypothetical protein
MEQNRNTESHRDPSAPPLPPTEIIPLATDHMPEIVEPLRPPDPETAMTQARRLRQDGWTPEKSAASSSGSASVGWCSRRASKSG